MTIHTISSTFDALVDETGDYTSPQQTEHAGILTNGRAFFFRYRRGGAALGLGDNVEEAQADSRTVVTAYGDPAQLHLEPAEFRAVMLDLLKLHPAAPPFPIAAHDVVTIHDGTRLCDVLRVEGDMGRVAPVAEDDTRDPYWVALTMLHRVDRYATGTTSDGKTWRLDQLHDRVRLIVGATVIDSRSALGSEGAAGAFETLWGTFSHGCADARRSDTPTAGAA